MGDTRDLSTEPTRHFYTMSIDKPTLYGLASVHVFRGKWSWMAYEDCQLLSFPKSALSRQELPKTCSGQVAHITSLPPNPQQGSVSWEQLWLLLTSPVDLMMSGICTVPRGSGMLPERRLLGKLQEQNHSTSKPSLAQSCCASRSSDSMP